MKRVRDTIIWGVLIVAVAALLFFSIQRKADAKVKTLVVNIEGVNQQEHLISEKEVKQILMLAAGKTITKTNIKSLNLRSLEARLNKDKRIERADLYFDSKDRLHVRIIQKKPILRIIDEAGVEYYLDKNGQKVPVTLRIAARVPIVTGIKESFNPKLLTSDKPSKLKDVFMVMQYISNDEFLSALIEQVHIESDTTGDMILIPKVGRERLIFGDASDIAHKFDKLKIFYRDGMPKLGWDRYSTLNLKYANQVSGKLENPRLASIIRPLSSDTLRASLFTTEKNQESIHH